ncbi:MAG: cytochrome c-type biogenesis protein CcmH [Patiriisocius sp.]
MNKLFKFTCLGRSFLIISMVFFTVNFSAYAQEKSTFEEPVLKQQYAENYVFAETSKRKEFLELTAVLRCPKCQNQNIAASDAPIAHDMRRKTYQLMQEGKEKDEIIEWMKVRYGDFVYYQPPITAVTIWLWVAPVLFAVTMLVFFIRRRKPELEQDIEAKLARADQMLKDD